MAFDQLVRIAQKFFGWCAGDTVHLELDDVRYRWTAAIDPPPRCTPMSRDSTRADQSGAAVPACPVCPLRSSSVGDGSCQLTSAAQN
jgi:hypothetical protein